MSKRSRVGIAVLVTLIGVAWAVDIHTMPGRVWDQIQLARLKAKHPELHFLTNNRGESLEDEAAKQQRPLTPQQCSSLDSRMASARKREQQRLAGNDNKKSGIATEAQDAIYEVYREMNQKKPNGPQWVVPPRKNK